MCGKKFIDSITACEVPQDKCAVWWLGQHSFIAKTAGKVLCFDPFLSDKGKRLIKPFFRADELTNADIVFGSHDHRDHIDRTEWPAIACASPDCVFVVPELHRMDLAESLRLPAERLVGMDDGLRQDIDGVSIHAVASAHELLHRDPVTGLHPFLGFVVCVNGFTLYHSGDTCIYEGLATKLSRFDIDLAMLPINGRDAERLARNCIGNMTYQEAVDLAGVLQPKLTIPTHFDMFDGNQENPQLFLDYIRVKFPHLNAQVAPYAEPVWLSR